MPLKLHQTYIQIIKCNSSEYECDVAQFHILRMVIPLVTLVSKAIRIQDECLVDKPTGLFSDYLVEN